METFGQRLRRRRIAAGLSRERLADLTGVDKGTVARWEVDRQGVRIAHVPRLATALNIPERELMEGISMPKIKVPVTRKYMPASEAKERKFLVIEMVGDTGGDKWRETIEWPEEDRYEAPLPVPSRMTNAKLRGFIALDDAIDGAYPSGAIMCVTSDVEPEPGKLVVAAIHKDGLYQVIARRISEDEQGTWLLVSDHPEKYPPLKYHHENISIVGVIRAGFLF